MKQKATTMTTTITPEEREKLYFRIWSNINGLYDSTDIVIQDLLNVLTDDQLADFAPDSDDEFEEN